MIGELEICPDKFIITMIIKSYYYVKSVFSKCRKFDGNIPKNATKDKHVKLSIHTTVLC